MSLNDYTTKYNYAKEMHHVIFGRKADDDATEMIKKIDLDS